MVGKIRRLSGTFEPERWMVDGREKPFTDYLRAVEWMLKRTRCMKFQVKTALSHEYWTGEGWSRKREHGKLYKTRYQALRAAQKQNEARNGGRKGWDEVVAVQWVASNWEDCHG